MADGQKVDFSDYQSVPPAATQHPAAPPPPGFFDTLGREFKAAGQTIYHTPSALYHAAADPATAEEKAAGNEQFIHNIGPTGRLIERSVIQPVRTAGEYYNRFAHATPDERNRMESDMLDVAPEAMGSAAGNYAMIKGVRTGANIARGASPATEIIGARTPSGVPLPFPKATAPAVRGVVKAANVAYPAAVGAGLGAAVGETFGHPVLGAVGGGIPGGIVRGITNRLPEIPGEDFGLSTMQKQGVTGKGLGAPASDVLRPQDMAAGKTGLPPVKATPQGEPPFGEKYGLMRLPGGRIISQNMFNRLVSGQPIPEGAPNWLKGGTGEPNWPKGVTEEPTVLRPQDQGGYAPVKNMGVLTPEETRARINDPRVQTEGNLTDMMMAEQATIPPSRMAAGQSPLTETPLRMGTAPRNLPYPEARPVSPATAAAVSTVRPRTVSIIGEAEAPPALRGVGTAKQTPLGISATPEEAASVQQLKDTGRPLTAPRPVAAENVAANRFLRQHRAEDIYPMKPVEPNAPQEVTPEETGRIARTEIGRGPLRGVRNAVLPKEDAPARNPSEESDLASKFVAERQAAGKSRETSSHPETQEGINAGHSKTDATNVTNYMKRLSSNPEFNEWAAKNGVDVGESQISRGMKAMKGGAISRAEIMRQVYSRMTPDQIRASVTDYLKSRGK